eukprot:CAMPEP_0169433134 /NCGR_PEP_ID=MMETSP1042-20121227/3848_1 /TAXON_ID=464988 /ORGANISM="Hemiselmis andersenii, Strain CCMP1180" /LENGTH=275 /DNA_ID=CAMNT_0009543651 /DNA_START=152 /DNA_END=975 /DNA_ORIENTATION=-
MAASRPAAISSADASGVARFIASEACKKVALLTGAGVSVAAGIPDFRSPGGMYATLPADKITCSEEERAMFKREPMYVVDKGIFTHNAFPYLEVRRPFILGSIQKKWKPTVAHWFARLLFEHNLLQSVYTQNIDGLDYHVGLPDDRIVPVHGSIGRVECEACGARHDAAEFAQRVEERIKDLYDMDPNAPTESSEILCNKCRKPQVKPSTVLFGSQLPSLFFERTERELPDLDLLIIAGTSLQVSPANGVAGAVGFPRVLVNRDAVGQELGLRFA